MSGSSSQTLDVRSPPASGRLRPTFRDVFEAELPFLWNTLRRFGVAERDIEDVAHDTLVVVDRRLPDFDPTRPLRPWLFAIAFRCASDYRRRARHRYEALTGDAIEHVDPGEGPDVALATRHEQNVARRALLAVPEDRRAVLVLHDFEGTAMRDIAESFGIPLKTAYSRLRIGRQELIAAARRIMERS